MYWQPLYELGGLRHSAVVCFPLFYSLRNVPTGLYINNLRLKHGNVNFRMYSVEIWA